MKSVFIKRIVGLGTERHEEMTEMKSSEWKEWSESVV